MLAKQLGESFFNEKIASMLLDWLSDKIYAIRDQSMASLNEIGVLFGEDWIVNHVLPKLMTYQNEENYLYRLTPLLAYQKMEPSIGAEAFNEMVVPVLEAMSSD